MYMRTCFSSLMEVLLLKVTVGITPMGFASVQ
jgi:hypothetical protein